MGRKPKEVKEETNVIIEEEVKEKKKRGPKKKETIVNSEIMDIFKTDVDMEEYKIDENELVDKFENLNIDEPKVKKQKKDEIVNRVNNQYININEIESGKEFNIYFEEKEIYYKNIEKYTDEELESKSFIYGLLFKSDDMAKIIGKEERLNDLEIIKSYRVERDNIVINFHKTKSLNTNELCNTFWLYKRRRETKKKGIYEYIVNDNRQRVEENRKIIKFFGIENKLDEYEFKKIYVEYQDRMCEVFNLYDFFIMLYENE